jgi:copper/silver efflux system protein
MKPREKHVFDVPAGRGRDVRVMLAYLDAAYRERRQAGLLRTLDDLIETVHATAVERVRPMALIGMTNILAMFPVMWSTGTGADVMKRVAAPMVGGVSSALLLTLVVIPALYVIWRRHAEVRPHRLPTT